MEDLKKFLNRHKCEKGAPFTHTSITNHTGCPSGSYHIPDEVSEDFFRLYKRAMVSGAKLYFTEKPKNPSPMRADLDFRFTLPEQKPAVLSRVYTNEHVDRIVISYSRIMSKYLDAPNGKYTAIVMEKPRPVEYGSKIKDGIHIIWPNLIVDYQFQHWIRKQVLDNAKTIFSDLNVSNSYEDVVDKAIIDRNNWQMYGSTKPNAEPYRMTRHLEYSKETDSMIDTTNTVLTSEFELQLVELLSMRKKADPTNLLPEAKEAIEEYNKLVLPSIDDKRKNKLNSEIFGKNFTMHENRASKDELDLANHIVKRCLNKARSDNYEDWIKLGWTLHNIDSRLLDTWLQFSSFSSKYNEGECRKMWNLMRNDTLGMGTLRWWAKKDNEIEYEHILSENVMTLIDLCVGSSGAHFDVARVIQALYKDTYRFTGKDCWYTFKAEKHRWVRSVEGLQLKLLMSTEVCKKFMERSIYWTNEALRNQDQRNSYDEKSKRLSDISIQLKKSGYKDGVLRECKCLFTDEKFEELLDSKPHLVGFENGVYDLRMHEFREGLPDDFISFSTGRYYKEFNESSEDAKEIDAFFKSVFTNNNVRAYVKDILACILDGGIRQERFYVFTGSGSNGKSKILELVQKAIGEYYCILPIALLTQKRAASNSAQSELERTKGRRFAVMQEPGENEKINTGLMKELSGGDRILTRGLFKEPIEFRPQFKMIMTCNELPEVASDDGGTWRRIRVVEFTSKFTDTPDKTKKNEFAIDMELSEKFDRWADTFVSMMIHHHKNLDPNKIVEPVEVRIATEGYKKNNDVIGQYTAEKITREENPTGKRLLLSKAFSDFRGWANQAMQKGKKLPDRNQFRAYMEKTYGVYPADGKGWKNISIISDAVAETNDSDEE